MRFLGGSEKFLFILKGKPRRVEYTFTRKKNHHRVSSKGWDKARVDFRGMKKGDLVRLLNLKEIVSFLGGNDHYTCGVVRGAETDQEIFEEFYNGFSRLFTIVGFKKKRFVKIRSKNGKLVMVVSPYQIKRLVSKGKVVFEKNGWWRPNSSGFRRASKIPKR